MINGGGDGQLDQNNNPIEVSSSGMVFKMPKRGTYIPTEAFEQTTSRGTNYTEDYDFKVYPGQDANEIAAQNQSRLNRWGKALPRLGSKVATEMAKTPGYLGGMVGFAASGDYTSNNFAEWIDNSWVRSLEEADQTAKDYFKIYTPNSVRDGNLWDNLSSASFWTTEGVDGAGFLITAMLQGGLIKGLGTGSRLATKLGKGANFARNTDLAAATAMNVVYEAASETQGLVKNLKDSFSTKIGREVNPDTGKVWTEEEANQAIGDAAVGTFATNAALLILPDYLMNKAILGRFSSAKGIINRTVDKTTGDLLQEITPLSRLEKIGNVLKDVGKVSASEGLLEEGTQFSVEKYFDKVANNKTDKGWLEGIASEYIDGLGTTEMQKAIALGGIFGTVGGITGSIRKQNQLDKDTKDLSNVLKNNFQGFSKKLTDVYEKDADGKPIYDPETKSFKKDPAKVVELFNDYVKTQTRSKFKDALAAVGNKEGFDFIANDEFTDFAIPYLQQEGGLEILNKHIDALSAKLVEDMKSVTGNDISVSEAQVRQNLKDKAAKLADIHDKAELYGPEFSRLKYNKADNEFANQFLNRIKFGIINESARQEFYQDRIKDLTSQLEELNTYNFSQPLEGQILDGKKKQELKTQIESYKDSFYKSTDNLKQLTDTKVQQNLFDVELKDRKALQAQNQSPEEKFKTSTPEATKFKEKVTSKVSSVTEEQVDSDTKIQKIDALIKDLEENDKTALEEYVKQFGETVELGSDYKKLIDAGFIDDTIKKLKTLKEQLSKDKKKIAHEAQRIIKSGNRLNQMIQWAEGTDIEFFKNLSQEDLINKVEFKVIDYPQEGDLVDIVNIETKEKLSNYPIKQALGIEGTKKGIQVFVDGRMIGQFVDPNRFKFRNEDNEWDDFDGTVEHLKWLNPEFTTVNDLEEIVPSKEGEQFIVQYLASQKAMESLRATLKEGKTEVSNEDLKKIFYIDSTISFELLTAPIKAVDFFNNNTNYYTIDPDGKRQNPIIYVKSDRLEPFYEFKDGVFHKIDKIYNDYYMNTYVRDNKQLNSIGGVVAIMEVPAGKTKKIISLDLQYQKVEADDTITKTLADVFSNLTEEFNTHKKAGDLKTTEIKGKGTKGLGILITSNFRKGTTNTGTGYTINLAVNGKKEGSDVTAPRLSLSLSVANDEFIELNNTNTPVHFFVDKNKEGVDVVYFKEGNTLKVINTKDELISSMNKLIENRIEYAQKNPDNKYSGLLLKWLLNKEGNPLHIFNFFKQIETNTNTLGDIQVQHEIKQTVYFKPQGKFIKEVQASFKPAASNVSGLSKVLNDLRNNLITVNKESNPTTLASYKEKLADAFNSQPTAIKENPEALQLYTGLIGIINSKLGATVGLLDETTDAGEDGEVITKEVTPKDIKSTLELERDALLAEQDILRRNYRPGEKEDRDKRLEISQKLSEIEAKLIAESKSADEQYMMVDDISGVEEVKFSERLENLRRILPIEGDNPVISVHDWNIVINNLRQNGIPIAKFFNSGIYLSKYGKGSEYHEAFHAVFRTFLNDVQILGVLKEAKTRYGSPVKSEVNKLKARFPQLNPTELNNLWYEEQMAEDYRLNKSEPKSLIGRLFSKIKRFVNWLFNNQSEIDNLFDDITSGKFKNAKRIESKFLKNIEVNSLLEKRAFKTSKGEYVSGYLSADSNRRLIKRLVASAYEIKDKDGKITDDAIIGLALDLASTYYNPDTYANKLDELFVENTYKYNKAFNTINDIRDALEKPSNHPNLIQSVKDGLSIFKFENYSQGEEEIIDDVADASDVNFGIKDGQFVGGLGSASKQMREYLSNVEVFEDEFNIGLTEQELKDLGFKTYADPFQLYNSIEATMVNTNRADMFPKLKVLADNNPSINSFYNKITRDIQNELGVRHDYDISTLPLTELARSNKFNLFIQNFSKVKQQQIVVLYDVNTGKLKVHRSNMNDVQDYQVTRWSNTWRARNLDNKKDSIKAELDKTKSLITSYETIQAQNLNSAIQSVKGTLNSIGIEVSPLYIKWSIIDTAIKSGSFQKNYDNGNPDTKEYMDNLLSFRNLFNGIAPIDDDFIQGLMDSFVAGNPYVASGVDLTKIESEEAVDEITSQRAGAIGRLKAVALGNSYFDENIGSFTFQNSEGKTVYSNVSPNYNSAETTSYQNPARRHWIFEQDENTQKSLLKQALVSQGKVFNDYQFESYFQAIKNNSLLLGLTKDVNGNITSDKEFSDFIFESFSIFINGGLTQTSLTQAKDEETGEDIVEEERFKRSTGTVHNDLDKRGKYITLLSYFAGQPGNTFITSKTKKIGLTQKGGKVERNPAHTFQFGLFKPYQTEGKSTQVAIQLPIQEYFSKGKLNDLGKSIFFNAFNQEFERIQKVKREIESGATDIIKDYNEGKLRGLKFFNFSNLEEVNKELYDNLLKVDKLTPELINEVELALEQMVASEFEGFIEDLKSPSVNIIQDKVTKDKDGVETTTTENYILPEYYVNADKSINIDKLGNFFFNDYINSLNFNNLMFGDLALNFKSNIDFVKRMAGANAAGASAGYGTSKVAVIADVLSGNGTNRTDAQSYGTPFWMRDKYILSYGKGNQIVNELMDKMVKGHDLTKQEVKKLIEFGALANPRKMTAFDTFFYLKTSVKMLLRSQVSWFDGNDKARKAVDNMYDELKRYDSSSIEYKNLIAKIHTYWKPRPEYKKLHDRLNEMELKGIDLLAHESAVKTAKLNVTKVGEELIAQEVSDIFIREQVSTDNMKSKIPHGSQLMQLITAEHPNPNQLVIMDGKEYKVGDIVNFYKQMLGDRIVKSVTLFRKFILNGNEANYKYLLDSFNNSLEESSSDFITKELFRANFEGSDKPKYNLNLPRIELKFQNMFLSYMSKSLHQKVAGFKLTLSSEEGNEVLYEKSTGKVISRHDFDANPKKYYGSVNYGTRRLEFYEKGNVYYAECKISAQLAEHFNLKEGDELPKEFLEMVGVRIPTQDKHSMVSLKVVEILPGETGNEIVMPYEVITLSGGDFDIDSEFVRIYESFRDYKSGDTFFYGSYLDKTTKEARLTQAFIEYTNSAIDNDIRLQDEIDRLEASEYDEIHTLRMEKAQLESEIAELKNKDLTEDEFRLVDALSSDDESVIQVIKHLYPETEELNNTEVLQQMDLQNSEISKDTKIRIVSSRLGKQRQETLKSLAKAKAEVEAALHLKKISFTNFALTTLDYITDINEFKKKFEGIIESNHKATSPDKIKALTVGEINNNLLKAEKVLIKNKGNEKEANAPADRELAIGFRKELYEASSEEPNKRILLDPSTVKSTASVVSKMQLDNANSTGKNNVGPSALFNIMFQYLNNWKVGSRINDDNFGSLESKGTNDRINAINSTQVTMAVDSANNQDPAYFNLNLQSVGAMLYAGGIGTTFREAGLLNIQPEVVNLVNELVRTSSEIKTRGEKSQSKANILERFVNQLKSKVDVFRADANIKLLDSYSAEDLKEALFFSQGNSKLTEAEYTNVQYLAVKEFVKNKKMSEFLQNFTVLLSLVRGYKTDWSKTNNYNTALTKLGIEVFQLPHTSGHNIEDFDLRHVKDFKDEKEKYPFDLLPVLRGEPLLYSNLRAYAMLNNDSKQFFIVQSDHAKKTIEKLKLVFKEGNFDYDDNYSKLTKELIAYYNMRAYKHLNNKIFSLRNLFSTKDTSTEFLDTYSKIASDEYWQNNFFIQSLQPDKTDYTGKDKSIFNGMVLRKLITNTRNKNKSPKYIQDLADSFRELHNGGSGNSESDLLAKKFIRLSLDYIIAKDSAMFRNNSFIQYIEPFFLNKIIKSLDNVQNVLSNSNSNQADYIKTFGLTKEGLEAEFIELFTRNSTNTFSLKSNAMSIILQQISKARSNKGVIEQILGITPDSDVSIGAAIKSLDKTELEKISPIWEDYDNKTLSVDIFKGVGDNVNKSGIRKANIAGLLNTGLFQAVPVVDSTNPDKKYLVLGFPEVIVITGKDENDENKRKLFKLKSVQQPKNINKVESDYRFGDSAVYQEVDVIDSKEVIPYAFSPKEWDEFIALIKAEKYLRDNKVEERPQSKAAGKQVEREYTPENITSLKPNEVFVFGSNAEGAHGKGAALLAKQKFGAKQGQSEGLQGQSYAIITKKDWRKEKSSSLVEINDGIHDFIMFALENPKLKFYVTKIGSSLAGYTIEEIRQQFKENYEYFSNTEEGFPDNIVLPKEYEVRSTKSNAKPSISKPMDLLLDSTESNENPEPEAKVVFKAKPSNSGIDFFDSTITKDNLSKFTSHPLWNQLSKDVRSEIAAFVNLGMDIEIKEFIPDSEINKLKKITC